MGRAGNFAGTPLDAQEATYQDIQGKERPEKSNSPTASTSGNLRSFSPVAGHQSKHSLSVCPLCHLPEPVMGSVCWSVGANSESKQKEIMK